MKPIFVIIFGTVALAAGADWCYKGDHCGQHTWTGQCQNRGLGAAQTPINIEYRTTTSKALKKLDFSDGYFQNHKIEATNNGHSLNIKLHQVPTPMTIAGDLTKGKNYTLDGIHFHWGAEHAINGKRYALEAHFVHFRSDFVSAAAAIASGEPNALCVFALLFQEGDFENVHLQPIVNAISGAKYKDESAVGENFNIFNLIPAEYKTSKPRHGTYVVNYYGSLTTPGCYQVVFWAVCTHPVPVSSAQMQQFKSMYVHGRDAPENEHLVNNYRELQDINGRITEVYSATFRRDTDNSRF